MPRAPRRSTSPKGVPQTLAPRGHIRRRAELIRGRRARSEGLAPGSASGGPGRCRPWEAPAPTSGRGRRAAEGRKSYPWREVRRMRRRGAPWARFIGRRAPTRSARARSPGEPTIHRTADAKGVSDESLRQDPREARSRPQHRPGRPSAAGRGTRRTVGRCPIPRAGADGDTGRRRGGQTGRASPRSPPRS